ncbi:MAG: pyridoxamine 5'-phosphate oxidase family protein [Dehalococcoidia bacterium]
MKEPEAELQQEYSDPNATPAPWSEAREQLEKAEIFWLSTVRPDGRPHVTPLIAVWLDNALYFTTGENEVKARNLENNKQCILTTGCNDLHEGLDVVVEGKAARVSDEGMLKRLADAWVAKYGEDWRFEVRDGAFEHNGGNRALVFAVAPRKVFAYGRTGMYSATRWRF